MHIKLEILKLAKQHFGELLHLSFETPILKGEGAPSGSLQFFQELVDLDLIEIHFKQVYIGTSGYQKDSWDEYCADLNLSSLRTWDLWRQAFIAEQEGVTHVLAPGERFGEFSEVWVEELRFRAVKPS